MPEELVQLNEGDTLVAEGGDMSSADLEKLISEKTDDAPQVQEPSGEAPATETVPDETVTEPPEPEVPDKETVPETVEEKVTLSEYENVKRDKEYLSNLLNKLTGPLAKPKEPEKKFTKDEMLQQFADDPEGFLNRQMEKRIDPFKSQIKDMEQQQAIAAARGNSQYSRLESAINKIKNSDYGKKIISSGLPPLVQEEVFLHMVRGMELQQIEQKSNTQKQKEEAQRLKTKKVAAATPKSTKKVVNSTPQKSYDKMNSKELEAEIKKLGAA